MMRRALLILIVTLAASGRPCAAQSEPDEAGGAGGARDQLREVMQDPLFHRWRERQLRRDDPGDVWIDLRPYAEAFRGAINDFFEWIFGRDSRIAPSGDGPSGIGSPLRVAAQAIAIVIAVIVVVALVILIRRVVASRPPPTPAAADLSRALDEGDALAAGSDRWLSHASELAGEEDLRLAFRAMYLALLAGLHEAGKISFRKQRTNWTYVRGFTGEEGERRTFAGLTDVFDSVWYGLRRPNARGFESLREQVASMLGRSGEGRSA